MIPDVGLPGKALAADFEEEPRTALSLVRPGIDQAGRRIILRLVRDVLCAAKRLDHVEIVGAEFAQHVLRRYELGIVVRDGLMTRDIADRSDGRIARFSSALGDRISNGEDLCGLLIE